MGGGAGGCRPHDPKVRGPRLRGHPQKAGTFILGGHLNAPPKCGDPHPIGHPIVHPKMRTPIPRNAPKWTPKMGTPVLWDAPMHPQSVGTPILWDTPKQPQKMGTPPPVGPHCAPQKCRFPAPPPAVPLHFRAPFGDPRPPLTSVPRVSDPHTWASVVSPLLCAPQQLLPHMGAFFSVASTAPPPPLKGGGCGGGAAWGPTVSCGSIPTNMGWGERGRMAWGDLWVLWGGRWQGVGGAVGWGCCGVADDIGWPMARDGGC